MILIDDYIFFMIRNTLLYDIRMSEIHEITLEIVWWLEKDPCNLPNDIIRYILSEWIYYEPIETNDKFRECIKLWLEERNDKERNNMIKRYGHISNWNTKLITDMSYSFAGLENFCEDLSHWNVSNVTDMNNMFDCCYSFTCDLSHWNVSQVTDMSYMFYNCESFQSNVSHWNVSQVTNMSYMFYRCVRLNMHFLEHWDFSNVKHINNMLTGCEPSY